MKRIGDIICAAILLVVLAPIMLMAALAVRATSPGPALYISQRVGRDRQLFSMPKFRSMKADTQPVATHLLADSASRLTPIGSFLRRSSIDELPQLLCVLSGTMSIVGPRPALFNQHDLIEMRENAGVHSVRPGITGWAQINGRDDLALAEKVLLDREYVEKQSLLFDLRILLLTVLRVVAVRGVSH